MPELNTPDMNCKWLADLLLRNWAAFGFAIACVALASTARLLLSLLIEDLAVLALYYPAVLVSSLIAGRAAARLPWCWAGYAAEAARQIPQRV
jgi:hypothetical protein